MQFRPSTALLARPIFGDMQVGMYYWKTCVSGGHHYFHENMCYGRTCVVGGHVLKVGMSCRSVQKQPFKLL